MSRKLTCIAIGDIRTSFIYWIREDLLLTMISSLFSHIEDYSQLSIFSIKFLLYMYMCLYIYTLYIVLTSNSMRIF